MSDAEERAVSIGEKIRCLREAADLSITEAAQRLDMPRMTWYRAEAGVTRLPTRYTLARIGRLFGLSVDELVEGTTYQALKDQPRERRQVEAHTGQFGEGDYPDIYARQMPCI